MLIPLLQRCILLLLLLLSITGYSQDILVLRNNLAVISGNTVAFPTAAVSGSSVTITVRNVGASILNLTGSPAVQLSGTHAANFSVTQPASTSLAPGQSVSFAVTYTPNDASVHQAEIRISSNDPDTNPYVIKLKGAGNSLYGPKQTPYGTVQTATNGEAGRAGGRDIMINGVSLGTQTDTYWGPSINSGGELQLKLSLDGSTYTDQEILTYIGAESDLANGKAVWRGQTKIQNAVYGTTQTVYIRATLTTKRVDNSTWALLDPTTIGLSEQVGGLIKFTAVTDYLIANYFIEASTYPNSGYQPYLTFYDNYPTPPGPLPGQGVGAAYSSISNGFYWKNLTPKLTSNQILILNEGEEKTISTDFLNATDSEDLPDSPEKIVFEFTNPSAATPLNFDNGSLKLAGVALTRASKFSLKDVQDGKLTYHHNGSETDFDQFQFSIRDSKGALAIDGGYTVYSFKIQVTPVDDAPVTKDTTFSASYAVPFNGQLKASDEDSQTLTFELVSSPTLGTVVINADGTFTYTPSTNGPGTDTFTYRVSDGNSYSNVSTVTMNLIDLPPTVSAQTLNTYEGKSISAQLVGIDPEGTDVVFELVQQSQLATVSLNADGSITYTPSSGKFGVDTFSYKAKDANGNYSDETVITVYIKPNLDEGDILIADRNKIWLYDPVNKQYAPITEGDKLSRAQNLTYKKGTSVFVLDGSAGLVKVNPNTGVQTVLAAASKFSSDPGPLGITLDKAGKLIIADGTNGIVKADTASGAVTPLFTGGNLMFSTGVQLLNNGDLLVTDAAAFAGGVSKVIRIAPSGTQTVISLGSNLMVPVDLALKDDNTLIVSDGGKMAGGADKLINIDLTTGTQQVFSTEGQLGFPSGIGYHRSFDKLYAVNQMNRKLLEVNSSTGVQTELPGLLNLLNEPFGLFVIEDEVVITSVSVPADGIYKAGDKLVFEVTFSEPVTVTGTPALPLVIGSSNRSAMYISGSGSNRLVFEYTVQEGEEDTDGITVGDALVLNGGTIIGNGNPANLTLNNVEPTTGVLVDAIVPVAPSISGITQDRGLSNADGITNDQTLSIGGLAEKASKVTVSVNGAVVGTTTANSSSGAWVFDYTATSLGEGRYVLTATATDAAGNISESSADFDVTIDITAPTVEISSTVGNYTNAAFNITIKLSELVGSLQPSDFTLTNCALSGLTTSDGMTYSAKITPVADGVVEVKLLGAKVSDIAGNSNTPSNTLSTTFDVTAPSGYSVAFSASKIDGSNVSSAAVQVTGAETGTTFYYLITSSNGGTPVSGSGTVTALGFVISNLDLTDLNDGTLTVSFYLQDPAGNKGASVTAQVEKLTRNIVSVEQIAKINVPIRTAFSNVPLPSKVKVTYANGETDEISVVWVQGNYDGNVAGIYQLTGQLILAPNTTNLDGKVAAVTVEVEPNKAPVDILLSSSTFEPNIKIEDVIGTFTTTDPDDTEHIYDLVTGNGDTHNNLFELLNNNELHLKSDKGLSGMVSFSIRVRSTDPYQNTIEKVFTLTKSAYNPEERIKLVNAFSPNGDGINDTWMVPELRYYNSLVIEVFDRSGVRLFHTTNPEEGWDGRNQYGKIVQGSYFYVIQVKDIDLVQKGVVTVIKK